MEICDIRTSIGGVKSVKEL